jgi:hypothetical protein
MANLQKWVRECKERGEVLPETQDELLYKFRKDKPISKVSVYCRNCSVILKIRIQYASII